MFWSQLLAATEHLDYVQFLFNVGCLYEQCVYDIFLRDVPRTFHPEIKT